MARTKTLSAIDIGTCKMTTVIASQDEANGKLRAVGVANTPSKGLRKSQIVDIEEAVEALTQSVEAAERMAGCSLSSAFVSISGAHIFSQNSSGVVAVANTEEEIVGEDVARVIEAAKAISLPSSREILHVIPRDFIVDGQEGIKDPMGMTGVRLETEAHIISGSATAMRNLAKCVTELGIDVSGLVFAGLAAADSVLTETEKELGVCLVDIGGGTTSLAVFVEGALSYSAVLPVGAKNITNDIAIGLRVSLDSAEKIKIALSTKDKEKLVKIREKSKKKDEIDLTKIGVMEEKSASYKTLTDGIILPRLNEIFAMIDEELQKSGFAGATPAGVVLSGGGARTVGIKDACKRSLSLPARVGEPKGLSGLTDEIITPEFAVTQGLVWYAAKNAGTEKRRLNLPQFGQFVSKIPVRGVAEKAIDFVKSFMP